MIIVFFYPIDLFKDLFIIPFMSNGFQYKSGTSFAKSKMVINSKFIYIAIIFDYYPSC